ncbi:MAG TPA: FAD binding domain-containing protein [Pseudolabrys sp.]|nr:FAD binding domain-containing protein [Pseudolabrys sp.]
MKSAPFAYSRPADVDEACALLAADDGARVIAGGQSLVPMMAMRLAWPTRLVDIARIASLSYVRDEKDAVAIGACTRQCAIERDQVVARRLPLLARTMPFIGHGATRARGTIGGSLAHADPAAELPLIAVTLDATLSYRLNGNTGDIAARDFFQGLMMTALPAGACLASVRFPVWPGKVGSGFHEVNARRSDFAFVAAAAQVQLDEDGKCRRIAIGVGAATATPIRLGAAEKALTGIVLGGKQVADAVRDALSDIEPLDDLHASAAYRRRAAAALAARAVADAKTDAERARHAH